MTFVSQQFLPKHFHSFVISPVLAWSVFVSFHLHSLRNFHTCQETDKSYSCADWIQSMASTQTKGSGSCISFIVYNSLQVVVKSEYSLMRQTWKFTSKWTWFVSIMLAWSFNKSRLFDYLAISVVQNERMVFWLSIWFRKAKFGEHYFRELRLLLTQHFYCSPVFLFDFWSVYNLIPKNINPELFFWKKEKHIQAFIKSSLSYFCWSKIE